MKNLILFKVSQINWKQLVTFSDNVNIAVEKIAYLLSTIIEKHAPLPTVNVSEQVFKVIEFF